MVHPISHRPVLILFGAAWIIIILNYCQYFRLISCGCHRQTDTHVDNFLCHIDVVI